MEEGAVEFPLLQPAMVLKVGTDCSGIEAPIQALRWLGIEHEHVFSSETDKSCIASIKANYSPNVLFGDPSSPTPDGDIVTRDAESVPYCDLYVAGFPCQPFSVGGARRGLVDQRGTVFEGCLRYIRGKRPKAFVLENVKHLLHIDGGSTFSTILDSILSIPGYSVSYKVMDTKDYGIPQSRKRVYIVGRRDASDPFEFPVPTACQPLDRFVDWEDASSSSGPRAEACASVCQELKRRNLPGVFFDHLHMQYSKPDPINKGGYPYAPCVTCNSYMWCVPMNRRATHKELLRLQGFPDDFNVVVSDTSLRKQIGNAMSVNVLAAIFSALLER